MLTPSLGQVPRYLAIIAASIFSVALRAEPTDADFLAARDAFLAADATALDTIAPLVKGHLLESYVGYWQLHLKLDEAQPERVRAFLERNDGTPLADLLRGEWLKSLGKRAQWAEFGAEYPKRNGQDIELSCYALQWRRETDPAGALSAARQFWLSGRDQPDACQPLFAQLEAQSLLTTSDLWSRFRLAHEAGNFRLAARLVGALPSKERPAQVDYDRVERNPGAVLVKGDFRFGTRAGRELALYALDRVARSDADSARRAWARWRGRVPEAERHYGNLLVAYNAARQLLPEANEWYRDVGNTPLNESQREWRVRAALRALAWNDVARAIDAMPESQAQEPAWRYWRARAFEADGRKEDSIRLFGSLAAEPHFYGFLAADAIGASIMPVSEPLPIDTDALTAFGGRPAVQRVLRLAMLSMRSEAQREWTYVVRGTDDRSLLLAAEFARRNRLYDRSINTAERTQRRHDFGLRYQTPYREAIGSAVRENSLDEAWVFGLTRQESRFAADVISSAGAIGLMQLMAPTARWIARQTHQSDYRIAQLGEPEVNARFGTYYLRYVLDRLDGLPVLATAAYNAGPGRAQSWRGSEPLEGAIYAETIPFNETRDYVKKVMANTMFYQAQLGLPYVTLTDRLGIVAARGASGSPVAAAERRTAMP
ncbi:MAG TPA: transglycosylase SLT domain-containing protein [Casimicrobiaceae bacterium]|jgi:soluble lytic murein transglycosylase